MLKIMGRTLVVLLVTAIIGAAVYFIASSTSQSASAAQPNTAFAGQPPQGEGNGMGPGNGIGSHEGGDGEAGFSSQVLLSLGKNFSIIALVTIVIVLLRKVFIRMPTVKPLEIT